MLSYLLFGWIGGLIMFFTQKHPEVRFHAAQSVITFGALHVVQIILGFLSGAGVFAFGRFGGFGGFGGAQLIFFLLYMLVSLASFGLWIFLSIQGYGLKHTKMPLAGNLAEKWAAS